MSNLIASKIGDEFATDLKKLRELEAFSSDPGFEEEWRRIKKENKERLAKIIQHDTGIIVDVNSIFDVQIKRFHEYKRQLLNVLHVIAMYIRIQENPYKEVVPRTFIFAGKAAPGYYMAKLIIRFINAVATVVNNDPKVNGRLKVVFLPNYRVSLAENIFPASDLSEQISTAGTEASGTGNMKFALNGALTIGTLDGANVEIMEEVGEENIYIFGLKAHEVLDIKAKGYHPGEYINRSDELQRILTLIKENFFSMSNANLFRPIYDNLVHQDNYLLMADFDAYSACQKIISSDFKNQDLWTKKSILNVARIGKFSSDRTIQEYAEQIWNVKPVEVKNPSLKYTLKK